LRIIELEISHAHDGSFYVLGRLGRLHGHSCEFRIANPKTRIVTSSIPYYVGATSVRRFVLITPSKFLPSRRYDPSYATKHRPRISSHPLRAQTQFRFSPQPETRRCNLPRTWHPLHHCRNSRRASSANAQSVRGVWYRSPVVFCAGRIRFTPAARATGYDNLHDLRRRPEWLRTQWPSASSWPSSPKPR